MEYTVKKLAVLSGVSVRTLRFYDEIGLLRPAGFTPSGHRVYGPAQVDRLQQILFFRELGLELKTIAAVMGDPSFDRAAALRGHLNALEERRALLEGLIENVRKTIRNEEGEEAMSDREKFEGFKRKLIDENETAYGREARDLYGDKAMDEGNAKFARMTPEQYEAMQSASASIAARLEAAVRAGVSPDGEEGRAIAALHREWLSYTWTSYTKEAHRGLTQMYLDDPRFTANYDKNVAGCARFLRDAVHAWLGRA